jgi:hypothetical protein
VEEGVWGVSPVAVVVFVVAGGVIGVVGVLLGLLAERRLRQRPRVRCVASEWEVTSHLGAGPLGQAVCSFEVDLFNEGELATGLRGLSVAFYRDGEQLARARLKDALTKRELWTIDLPSRRWAHASAYALAEDEAARAVEGYRRADFVGEFPDGRELKQTIVERGEFVATRKRAGEPRKDYVASRNFWVHLWRRRRSVE